MKQLPSLLLFAWALMQPARAELHQAGLTAKLVRWTPVLAQFKYHDILGDPGRIADYEQQGHATVELMEHHDIQRDSSRTVVETVSLARLMVTTAGVAEGGNLRFWLDASRDRAEIREAYVLQPDGSRIHVSPDMVQFTSDSSPKIFDDSILVTIPYPQLRTGSIAVLTYRSKRNSARSPVPWSRVLYSRTFKPVMHFHVQVRWTKPNLKPSWKTDDGQLQCRETALSLVCDSAAFAEPLPVEPDMPSPYDVMPTLVLAEPMTWPELASHMKQVTESALSEGDELNRVAGELVAGIADPGEKIDRLFHFVARDVRYVGLEHGHAGVIPKPTRTTLATRFGDCKDKTLLFVDLARRAGLDAYPVLTSTERAATDKLLLPSTHYFNHMIACVRQNQDDERCIDLADPETSSKRLPHELHGAVRLVLNEATTAPDRLGDERHTWVEDVHTDVTLNSDGSTTEKLDRRLQSHWAASLRHNLKSKNQTERQQWLKEAYQNVVSAKAEPEVGYLGLESAGQPLTLTTRTRFPNSFDPRSLRIYQDVDPWLRDLLRSIRTRNSRYPYKFKGLAYKNETTIRLPNDMPLRHTGAEVHFTHEFGELHRVYHPESAGVTVQTELAMPNANLSGDEIIRFNRFLDLIEASSRLWFSVGTHRTTPMVAE